MAYLHPTAGAMRAAQQQAAIPGMTDNSGGTANSTLEAVGGAYSQTVVANNTADLSAKLNAVLTALRAAGVIAT